MEKSDFHDGSVALGLQHREFMGLPKAVRRQLLRLIARVSEKSYRRGFQQGATFGDRCVYPLADFRFNKPLDLSPATDRRNYGFTAIERVLMEYPVLTDLGFPDPSFEPATPTTHPQVEAASHD
jgi:hypothetical protein